MDWDGDAHSIILGGQDCNNREPTIHPFAPEIAANGIDEDCDGKDLPKKSVALTEAKGRVLDAQSYRRQLHDWRAEPLLSQQLRRTSQCNVVLIILDALRADQLRPETMNIENHPRLFSLFASGRHFRRAFANGAGTDIGMATIFTGELDPRIKRRQTLLKAFHGAGYTTFGIFPREVERWVSRQFPLEGLTGRHLVINDPQKRDRGTQATAQQVTDVGIRFLQEQGDRRFLLWLHYFDIHEHHQIKFKTIKGKEGPSPAGDGAEASPSRGLPFYRRMIRHVDWHLGRFFEALKALGLDSNTILVIMADHGEGLALSPRLPFNHGDVLYQPLTHVPLAFLLPQLSPKELLLPVSIADVFPTLLDLAGIPYGPTYGLSLIPFLFDHRPREIARLVRPIFMFEARQRGVILWPWKFLAWHDQALVELYKLERDPDELKNLADELPPQAQHMAQILNSQPAVIIDRLTPQNKKR
jgi:arylsulfatase A-like enzyme